MTDVIVTFHFGSFFALLHPNSPKNQNLKKMKKTPGDIIILHTPKTCTYTIYMYQKLWSDGVQFLRYCARRTDGWTDGRTEQVTLRWVPHLKNYSTDFYLSTEDISDLKGPIPSYLNLLMETIFPCELKQSSISQCILKDVKPRSIIPQIPFGLGVELDHVFDWRWLINELHKPEHGRCN